MRVPKLRAAFLAVLFLVIVLGWTGVLGVPLLNTHQSIHTTPAGASISEYEVAYALRSNGELVFTETTTVDLPDPEQHFIDRTFDTQQLSSPFVSNPVAVVQVERLVNGFFEPQSYSVIDVGGGKSTIRIGSPDVALGPGPHVFRLVGATNNAITSAEGGPRGTSSQWRWNVIDGGWALPIRKATVKMRLPVTLQPPQCTFTGGTCQTVREGTGFRVDVTEIPAGIPVTVNAFFSIEPPPLRVTPWVWRQVAAVAAFSLLCILLAVVVIPQARRKHLRADPRFTPPGQDILLAAWTLDRRPVLEPVAPVILDLINRGVLVFDMDRSENAERYGPEFVRLMRTETPMPVVTGYPAALAALGLVSAGDSTSIRRGNVDDGRRLALLADTLRRQSSGGAKAVGYAKEIQGAGVAVLLNWICMAVMVLALLAMDLGLYIATALLVPAVVGLGVNHRNHLRLTGRGEKIRAATRGFQMELGSPADQERVAFGLRLQYFERYLPWAAALDCLEPWVRSCRGPSRNYLQMGQPATTVDSSQLLKFCRGLQGIQASAARAYAVSNKSRRQRSDQQATANKAAAARFSAPSGTGARPVARTAGPRPQGASTQSPAPSQMPAARPSPEWSQDPSSFGSPDPASGYRPPATPGEPPDPRP